MVRLRPPALGQNPAARSFYEAEALRGGWSVRQLDRQVNSQFYERSVLSKNKVAMLEGARHVEPGLSQIGLKQVSFASPGTADRNRTLSLRNLGKIKVPLPSLAVQRTFNALQTKVAELKAKHAAIREANRHCCHRPQRIFQSEDAHQP